MPNVYEVSYTHDTDAYFPTKKQALAELENDYAGIWRIAKVEIIQPTSREDFCNLLNGTRFQIGEPEIIWEEGEEKPSENYGDKWAAVTLNNGVIAIGNKKSEVVAEVSAYADDPDPKTTRTASGLNWEYVNNSDITIGRIPDLIADGFGWAFDDETEPPEMLTEIARNG